MKDEHGETDNRLYARPAIQDAGVETHPAIATDQSADIYDPSGTTRTDWIGEDTAKQRIFVAQGQTTSRQKEATRSYYSAQNLIARAERRAEAEAQGTGGSMSDAHVRFATRRLEKAIIALQRKRGWQTFTYAKEA